MVHQLTLPITKLIKDNLSLIMMFAYSQEPLREFRRTLFAGDWPYVDEILFTLSEQTATRALLELALLFRTLDDQEDIDDGSLNAVFGTLFLKDGGNTPLHMRDVANKIIHAQKHEWIFTDSHGPILRAIADRAAKEKWTHADVDIKTFAVGCGMLMS